MDNSLPATKHCCRCQNILPVEAFCKDNRRKDGHYPICRSCSSADYKGRRAANPLRFLEQGRRWREANREKDRVLKKKYAKKARRANPEKFRVKRRQQYQEHGDKDRAYGREYNKTHKEEKRLRAQRYAKEHPNIVKASAERRRIEGRQAIDSRRYNQKHPERVRAQSKQYRARKRGAKRNDLTAAQWEAIKKHYGYRCVYCGRKMQRLTQDHLTPLSQGGDHTLSNIVPACRSCNAKKGPRKVLVPVQPLLLL